jgi:hypothetical protein
VNQGFRVGVGYLGKLKLPGYRRPLKRRLIIGQNQGYRLSGFKVTPRGFSLALKLGDMPILAEGAVEVTAREAQGKDRRTGAEVVEGFLLNRIAGKGGHIAVPGDMALSPQILPYTAGAPTAGRDQTVAGAEFAREYVQL